MLPNACLIIIKRDFQDLSSEIFTSEYNMENFYSYDTKIAKYLYVYRRVYEALALKVPNKCISVSFGEIIHAPEDVVNQISGLIDINLKVSDLKRNVASFEYKSLIRNHYAT